MNFDGKDNFSNFQQPPPPPPPQPPHGSANNPVNNRITLNKNYLISIAAIFRILIIVFQFAAWIAAASIPKIINGVFYYYTPEFSATRSAYLFFSLTGFIGAIILFVLHLLNIVNVGGIQNLPWILIMGITDVIWFIPTFILGIVCAVRETEVNSVAEVYTNKGAFGAASFFAFLCALIYGLDAAVHFVRIVREGIRAKPPSA